LLCVADVLSMRSFRTYHCPEPLFSHYEVIWRPGSARYATSYWLASVTVRFWRQLFHLLLSARPRPASISQLIRPPRTTYFLSGMQCTVEMCRIKKYRRLCTDCNPGLDLLTILSLVQPSVIASTNYKPRGAARLSGPGWICRLNTKTLARLNAIIRFGVVTFWRAQRFCHREQNINICKVRVYIFTHLLTYFILPRFLFHWE